MHDSYLAHLALDEGGEPRELELGNSGTTSA